MLELRFDAFGVESTVNKFLLKPSKIDIFERGILISLHNVSISNSWIVFKSWQNQIGLTRNI